MKIIKLFLLLTLVVLAQFKLDIPNEVDREQLHSSRLNIFLFYFYRAISDIKYTIGVESDDMFISDHIAKFMALTEIVPSLYSSYYSHYNKHVKCRKRLIKELEDF